MPYTNIPVLLQYGFEGPVSSSCNESASLQGLASVVSEKNLAGK